MTGKHCTCAAGGVILLSLGCAHMTPMDQGLMEARRLVEVDCMKELMDQGLQLTYFGESMWTYCRQVSRRTVAPSQRTSSSSG